MDSAPPETEHRRDAVPGGAGGGAAKPRPPDAEGGPKPPAPKETKTTGATRTIRVVDAKRPLADITLLGPEELRTILEALVLEFDPTMRQALFGLEQIAADLRALRDLGPAGGAALTEGPQAPSGKWGSAAGPLMGEVALRQLLNSDAVRPVVTTASLRAGALAEERDRGQRAQDAGSIRVRPGVRKPVYAPDTRPGRRGKYRDAAVAAEQPIEVEGLVLDPKCQGGLILDVLAGDVLPGLWPIIDSGTFVAAVLSVVLARDDPSVGPRLDPLEAKPSRGVPAILPYTPELVSELRRQLGAALGFHLSGAGAALALDTAAAKLRSAGRIRDGDPGVAGIADAIVQAPTRGVDLPTRDLIEFFVGRIADVFPGVVATPEEFVFALTPLLDIFRVGAFAAYYHVLTEGREALGARRFLERAAIAQAERDQLAALEREIFAETAQARHYMIIVEDKFGAGRAHAIAEALALEGPTAADSPETVLGKLQKREREIVTTEYENRRHEWEAQSNNKCPHVRLAYRLRSAKSSKDALEILKKLAAYFKRPQATGTRSAGGARAAPELEWILCKNCGFRVICPHVEELIQMEARNLPYDAVRTRLMKYAVQYTDRSGPDGGSARDTYSYFCRICSERLAEFTGEDRTADILGAVGDLDDYVRKVIWIEAVNAAEFVRFPMPVDPRKFAGTAVGVCHPLLLEAEATLLKRGRRAAAAKKPRPGADDRDPFGDEESVDPRTHLYIALFVYAYILNLIRSSHEASKEESRRLGFEGVRPGSKMSKYAEAILSAVLKKYAGLISRIEDITPEFIADRFREAYRLVVGEEGPQELTSADEAKMIVTEIVTLSPAYHYIAIAARVFGALPIDRPLAPPAAKREFETVLGRTLPEILEDRATDSKSELVQMLLGVRPTGRGARRVAVEYPRGSDPLYIYSEAEVNFLLKMFRAPDAFVKKVSMGPFDKLGKLAEAVPACSDLCVVEAVGGRAAPRSKKPKKAERAKKDSKKDPKKDSTKKGARPAKRAGFDPAAFLRGVPDLDPAASGLYLRSYELFAEYVTEITSAEAMAAYQDRLAEARTRERGYLLLRAAYAVKNYRQYGFTVSRRFGLYEDLRPAEKRKTRVAGVARPTVPLTYLYDEDGLAHTWVGGRTDTSVNNVYLYSAAGGDKKSKPVELGRKAIVKRIAEDLEAGLEEGPIHGRTLLDVKCGVCGVLLSEVHTLDEKKARKSLQALSEFAAFFSFYDSRCPVDGLHDFPGAGAPCSKCGILEVLIFGYGQAKNAAAARAYYDKYLKRYREQRDVVTTSGELMNAVVHDLTDHVVDALRDYGAFAKQWKYDYTQLVRAAELIDVPVAALETLGATEGREYADVLSGANAPPPPTSVDDPRLLAVDSDVRVFITAYNRLRYVNRFSKPGLDTENVLQEAKVPKHEYEALAELLPDIFDGYFSKRIALLHLRSPADVLLFSIESLARMALAAASIGAKGQKHEWLPRLGREFAQRTLREVVRSERLLAKNGPFNFKIFGEDDVDDDEGAGDFAAGEFGDAGEDVLAEIDANADEDGAHDAFSLEGVDIDDDDPNLEPE
jgi:hypothetical protein